MKKASFCVRVKCSSINPVIGQEKEEKRTMVKAFLVENGDKVKKSKTEKARNECSIVGQVAYEELCKTTKSKWP